MAGLNPSPDTQAALGDQVSGAFAGTAKFESGKITGALTERLNAGLDVRKTEEELRGLKEVNPLVLDAAIEAARGIARLVEWRANRIDNRATERERRAQGHIDRLTEIRQRTIDNEEARRKAEIASEVLRVLDLPGGGIVSERPPITFEGLRERWNQHWADADARRAKRDQASAEGYRGAAGWFRDAANAAENGWRAVMDKHEKGSTQANEESNRRRQDAETAELAARDAFAGVMAKGPAEAIAARAEIMAKGANELGAQKQVVEDRTANVVSSATNP